jgi:hypothetical protein
MGFGDQKYDPVRIGFAKRRVRKGEREEREKIKRAFRKSEKGLYTNFSGGK